ncbi:MAG: hypothetical protein H6581_28940 [Bacteroidia bacterium]|nr:hypothetical protein [Bacteroidia bacterium]
MKVVYFSLILFLFSLAPRLQAQNMTVKQMAQIERTVFKQALKISDFSTAIHALHVLSQLEPNNAALKDSLCMLYFSQNAYEQTVLMGRDILEKSPDNLQVMEMTAVAEQALGLLKESLARYENLYQKTGNIFHLYEKTVIEFNLKRYGEVGQSLEAMLKHPKLDQEAITLNVGQNQSQEVPLKATVYNLRGVMNMELKNYDQAKLDFEESLKHAAAFVLPLNNLKKLEELKK